jgi:hypothetical protein
MEDSEKTLDMFWKNHHIRLNKCLDLRKFEQDFKDVSTFNYYLLFLIFSLKVVEVLLNPTHNLIKLINFILLFSITSSSLLNKYK